MSANKYCSPTNFDCNSRFRVYFLFNSLTKHRSSNLQLSLDCSARFSISIVNSPTISSHLISSLFDNVTKVTQAKIQSPKFALSIVAKTATICMYYVTKRGPNTCKKQMFSLPKSARKLMKKLLQCNMQYGDIGSVILLVTSSQSNSRGTHPISRVHGSNITCQKLQWSEIEPPQ